LQQLRTLDGIAVTSDDKIKAINLHGGDESDLKHRRETFRKHFGSSLEFEDPLPPFIEPERSPFDVDLCDLPGLEMYLRTIFEAADTSPSVWKSPRHRADAATETTWGARHLISTQVGGRRDFCGRSY